MRRANGPGLWVLCQRAVGSAARPPATPAARPSVTLSPKVLPEPLTATATAWSNSTRLVESRRQGVARMGGPGEQRLRQYANALVAARRRGIGDVLAGLSGAAAGLGFRPPGHGRPGRASAARRCRQSGEARASRCCSPPGRDAASCPVRGGVAAPRPDRAVLRRGGRPRSITRPICGGRTRSCCWATSSVGAAAGSTIRHNWPTTCGPTSCR